MAEEHPGVGALRDGFKAFATADMHRLSELFADDIEFVIPGKNPLSGVFKGKIEMFGFFGNLIRESKGSWKTELVDVLANDNHAVCIITATAKRGDKDLELPGCAIFDTNDKGKITRAVFMWEDQHKLDDFWAGALS